MDQHQQTSGYPKSSLTSETSHWTSSSLGSAPLYSFSRLQTLISKWKAKFNFIWKEDFGLLSNSPVIFFLAQVRCFWWCFCFRSGIGSPFPEDVWASDSWCTDSSFSSLLVKLSQVFESAFLDSILKLAVILVACAYFPTQCLPSSQLSLKQHSLNSHPFQRWPSVTYPLCGGCQCSSSGSLPSQQCSPLLWFQRTRDTHNVFCMDGHLLKLTCT